MFRSLAKLFGSRGEINAETRLVALIIVPILVAAFIILFVFPDSNGERFPWPVRPRLTAMTLGATYMLGALYFTTVLFAHRWREVEIGLLAVSTFAALLGIATIIHWDLFNHEKFQFWLWTFLYFSVPLILPAIWWRNRATAQRVGTRVARIPLPYWLRIALTVSLLPGLAIAAALFLAPGAVSEVWPWTITPLTARVIASEFALYGILGIRALTDPDWTRLRTILRWQLLTPVLYLIAVSASWNDLDTSSAFTWIYLVNGSLVFVAGVPALYFYMERKRSTAQTAEGSARLASSDA